MTGYFGWRLLWHEKARNALAVGGIFIAVLMIFLQLGFYSCVPKGGMQVYNQLRFDLLMTSTSYVFQGQSYDFPRRRLYQALSLPEVISAAPFYQSEASWLNMESRLRRDVFVMAFNPDDEVFKQDDIERQREVIKRPDTVLVDAATLAVYGPQASGRLVEIGERAVTIGGRYSIGTGFLGLGVILTSDLNFVRMFPDRSLATVNLGLIRLNPGTNAGEVAARLREILPADTKIFTHSELEAEEVKYWRTRTATGLIFGFGVAISIVVGIVILYQTMATQVIRHLAQYATLKAIGYTDGYLSGIVVSMAVTLAAIAFVPSLAAALIVYDKVRAVTRLPIEMTGTRLAAVLVLSLAMSALSALIAARILRRANPADLF
jgi:putative ABC transport system permease protein